MTRLVYPFSESAVRALKAGETVSVNGLIRTGRDRFHKHFADGGRLPCDFRDGAIYHCGPVVVQDQLPTSSKALSLVGADVLGRPQHQHASRGVSWRVVAAGPTTSVRENGYEPAFIEKTGVRLIIGKGGMDARTLAACRTFGAVYLQAVGGAAALAAACVKRVPNVYFLREFGAAEACWEFEVEDFQCVVGMDTHGNSLFDAVRTASEQRFAALIR